MTHGVGKQYVVDASVAMKWYLNDEMYSDSADAILTGYGEGRFALVAPQQIHYEVTNALQTAVRRGRLTADHGRLAAVEFLQLDLPVVVGINLIVRGWDAAQRFGCALYGGLYLALAEMTNFQLVHADKRLRNTLAGRFPLEMWIGDLVV